MGTLYLPLDQWLPGPLAAAGLPAPVFYDGWRTRARKSGGFNPGQPYGVMWHHTASSTSTTPAGEAQWECHTSPDAPIANVNISRGDGCVWVLAAGRVNTNGKGGPWTFSRGTVPVDQMNDHAFGMELANTGVGEKYSPAQMLAATVVSNTINARCGNRPDDVCTHRRWAPTRKIDPATAGAVTAVGTVPWTPRSETTSGTWQLEDLQAMCAQLATDPTPTPPPPITEDDDVKLYLIQDPAGAWWTTDSATFRTYVPDVQVGYDGISAFAWSGRGDTDPIVLGGAAWSTYLEALPITGGLAAERCTPTG